MTPGDVGSACHSRGVATCGDTPEASQRVTRQTQPSGDVVVDVKVIIPATAIDAIADRVATIVVEEINTTTTANGRAELLTTREAASLLGVHRRTVSRLVERDELHAYDIAGCPRFRLTEIEEYIESSKREPRTRSPRPSSKRGRSAAEHSSGLSFAQRLRCPERQ